MMDNPGALFRDKHVLITGGLGFIGSALAEELVQHGARVTIIDSLIPEYGGKLHNVGSFSDRIKVNISDVRDPYSLRVFLAKVDVLFNLAGQTSHMDSMTDPVTDLEINAKAQLQLLEACRKENPGVRIVFASTRQLYGRPSYLPVDESHPIRPVDVNGINKLAGEQYHILYNDVYGIKSTVLRLTNTVGPRMRICDARQTFVGVWIRAILENTTFEVWGGEQRRDFTYVDDCVQAMLLAATTDAAVGQIINIGGCPPTTLRELAETLIAVAGKGAYVVREFPAARKKIDIGDFFSNYDRAKAILSWQPRVGLREGLARTVRYFEKEWRHYV